MGLKYFPGFLMFIPMLVVFCWIYPLRPLFFLKDFRKNDVQSITDFTRLLFFNQRTFCEQRQKDQPILAGLFQL